jgi:hypothetical protein
MLCVLVRAGTRSVRRIEMILVVIRDGDAWLCSGRSKPQDHVGRDPSMSDERRVELKRQVDPRDRGVDGEHVRARPRAGRLALGGYPSRARFRSITGLPVTNGTVPGRPVSGDASR